MVSSKTVGGNTRNDGVPVANLERGNPGILAGMGKVTAIFTSDAGKHYLAAYVPAGLSSPGPYIELLSPDMDVADFVTVEEAIENITGGRGDARVGKTSTSEIYDTIRLPESSEAPDIDAYFKKYTELWSVKIITGEAKPQMLRSGTLHVDSDRDASGKYSYHFREAYRDAQGHDHQGGFGYWPKEEEEHRGAQAAAMRKQK